MNSQQQQVLDDSVERLVDRIRQQGLALSTERRYSGVLRAYSRWLVDGGGRSLVKQPSREKVQAFLTAEAKRGVSESTQNGAMAALVYWYEQVLEIPIDNLDALRAKVGEKVRQAPSVEDIRKLLMAVQDTGQYPTRLITFLMYGCGLRLGETLSIRLKDLDLDAGKLTIIGGKGKKDRFINLPSTLIPHLRLQAATSTALAAKACAMGVPVKLPHLLAKARPKWQFALRWWWLFPQSQPCTDPRGGGRVWWHCLEGTVQKSVGTAAEAAGVEGISPHLLRHAWATHAHDRGAHLRDIQEILGHKDPKTTMRYLRPDPERVSSPLEALHIPFISGRRAS